VTHNLRLNEETKLCNDTLYLTFEHTLNWTEKHNYLMIQNDRSNTKAKNKQKCIILHYILNQKVKLFNVMLHLTSEQWHTIQDWIRKQNYIMKYYI